MRRKISQKKRGNEKERNCREKEERELIGRKTNERENERKNERKERHVTYYTKSTQLIFDPAFICGRQRGVVFLDIE